MHLFDLDITPAHGGQTGTTLGYTILLANKVSLATSVLGSEPLDPSKGIIVSAARDCRARDVQGAVMKLIDDATGAELTSDPSSTGTGLKTFYFDQSGFPNTKCKYTMNEAQSAWSALNAPTNTSGSPPTHSYTLQFGGRRGDLGDTQPRLMYSVPLELWAQQGNVPRPFKLSPLP